MTPMTKILYRQAGNVLGNKRRKKGLPAHYIQRAHHNLSLIEAQGGIRDGMRIMELGTGWAHWEALFPRLFYDVEALLFDVWDNRQFAGFIGYAHDLRQRLRNEVDRPAEAIDRAEALLDQVLRLSSFEDVYALLGFRYIVSSDGSLDSIADGYLDLIVSSDVLEHVHVDAVPSLIKAMHRVLKPGSFVGHKIVPFDHLKIYAKDVHDKNYLQFDDTQWNRWFANDVQYQNRIQHSEWIDLFEAGGFTIDSIEVVEGQPLNGLSISKRFSHLPAIDLVAINTSIVARRSASA